MATRPACSDRREIGPIRSGGSRHSGVIRLTRSPCRYAPRFTLRVRSNLRALLCTAAVTLLAGRTASPPCASAWPWEKTVHGDSARDMNGDHGIHEDEVKRSRAQYNGEQIYSNLSPNMWAKWTKQDELKASMADLPTSNGSPYHHLTSQTSQPAPPSQGGAFEQAFSPVVSSAEKQPAEYDVAMTTINSQSTAVYSPPLGSNSLTPLTPISMQEVKSLVNSGASLIETSPNPHSYHPAAAATGSEIQGSPSPAKAEAPCPLSSLTVLQPVQGAIPGYGSSFSQFSAAPGKCLSRLVAEGASHAAGSPLCGCTPLWS
ncbi:hypothetical protein HPB51_021096 [Rhipicephalus microplus]|uniref:Uncharacterized protein n=1 Tax=Rhipicephalus microplus TaxID=6941 RepID=A0A9J6EJ55_RHIMP|nr:hypothetical protein HPB51_021096 [Rhipicephalus microplus]